MILNFTPGCAVINESVIHSTDILKVQQALKGYDVIKIDNSLMNRFCSNFACLYSPVKKTEVIFMGKHSVGLVELDREIVYTSLTNAEAIGGVSAYELIAKLY